MRHIGELEHLVLVVRHHERRGPCEVLVVDIGRAYLKLESRIAHASDVVHDRAEACYRVDHLAHEQVAGVAGIPVECDVEPAEQCEVETNVECVVLFPAELVVAERAFHHSRKVVVLVGYVIHSVVRIERRRDIAVDAVAESYLAVGEPVLARLEELLMREAP